MIGSTSTAGGGSPGEPPVALVVGRIGKPHGVRGEVSVDIRTDDPALRFAPGSALRAERPRGAPSPTDRLTVRSTRQHLSRLLVVFEEIPDREIAEASRGILLYAELAPDAVPDDEDDYYDHQLVGLGAYDEGGTAIGEITGLVHGSAQDLLAVRATDGRDTLVPFVTALVTEVDLAGRRVVIADRPGLVAPFEDEA